MENLDLDINNYDLNDLLNLFKLNYDFDKNELKRAKKIVLMLHPDKSGLNDKYFLFFSSAYKLIYNIYEFRYKSEKTFDSDRNNYNININKNEENEVLLKNIKNNKNFNKWFNEMFEKHEILNLNSKNGYGSWLSSNDDIDTDKTIIATKETMNNIIDNKKKQMRDLIIYKNYTEISNNLGLYDLTDDTKEYSSDIFSKFQYEDLKKAHTETLIPVTIDDYLNKKKYNNIFEFKKDRDLSNTNCLSTEKSMEILKQKQELEIKSDVERAYKLAKQEEDAIKMNKIWWSKIKQLDN